MIATCSVCGRLMAGNGCTIETAAYRWGSEPDHDEPVTWPCHDCGVNPGGVHHAYCAVAICSVCGDQAAGCDHLPTPARPN
jgi:hypothetical protein